MPPNHPPTILQISDLHIGHDGSTLKEERHLARCVKSILDRWNPDSTCIVITGDIGDRGSTRNFDDAMTLLQPLYDQKFQILVVPGNHDFKDGGWFFPRDTFQYFVTLFNNGNGEFPQAATFSGYTLIGVNSTGEVEDDLSWAQGKVGEAQLERLDQMISQAKAGPNNKIVVYLHHHPFELPETRFWVERESMLLRDNEAFMRTVEGKIDVLIFGHKHLHRDFSHCRFRDDFNIPTILSCSKTTKFLELFPVKQDGMPDTSDKKQFMEGYLGWAIILNPAGAPLISCVELG